jgi:hypothetical protein
MNANELRALYTRGYKIVREEKSMRLHVFRGNPSKQAAKVAEMDELLAIMDAMKDELKKYIGDGYEQVTLLDVPRKAEYK